MNSSDENIAQELAIANTDAEGDFPVATVVIPVFNEVSTIAETLELVHAEQSPKEIIVVDDGSTDGTREAIAAWSNSVSLNGHTLKLTWIRHSANRGKGSAIRSGLAVASGQFVIVQDADLELRPGYDKLLEPLLNNSAQFVIGRRQGANKTLSLHRLGVISLNWLIRALYGYSIRDSACGFKLLSVAHLRSMELQCEEFEFCPEVVAKASQLGLVIAEVSVDYAPRRVSDGKKLRLLKDGLKAIWTLFYWRNWRS